MKRSNNLIDVLGIKGKIVTSQWNKNLLNQNFSWNSAELTKFFSPSAIGHPYKQFVCLCSKNKEMYGRIVAFLSSIPRILASNGALQGEGLYVPRLNFNPFHVATLEGSHVAVGISSKATDIDNRKCYTK